MVAPQAAQSKVDQPIRERFALNQSLWIESAGSRLATLEAISRALEGAELEGFQRLDDHPVRLRDFYALGFAFLQIHLLTRRLRYSSNLNQPLFTEQLMEAAKASLAGDDAEADRWIQSCFDQLSQERDHYYSQTAYLIDVVLLAPILSGRSSSRNWRWNGRFTSWQAADLSNEWPNRSPSLSK